MKTKPAAPAPSTKTWLVPLLAGLLVCASISFVYSYSKARPESLEVRAARGARMRQDDYSAIMSMTTYAEKHHSLTESDWASLKKIWSSSSHNSTCFGPMRVLSPSFAHRDEAVSMARQYLGEKHHGGYLVATISLRSMGDPNWKNEADRLMNSSDLDMSRLAKNAFSKKR